MGALPVRLLGTCGAEDQADLIKIVDALRRDCAVVETYTRVILREFVAPLA